MLKFSDNTVSNARDFDRASAPEKMRVHALAKAVGITSKELIAALGEMGVAVKAASSSVAAGDRDRFLDAVAESGALDDVAAPQPSDVPVEGAVEKKAGENAGEPVKKPAAKAKKTTAKKATAKKAAKKTSKKTAKRTAGKKSAPAKKAEDVDVAETIVAEAPPVPETPAADISGAAASETPKAPERAESESGADAGTGTGTPEKATGRSRSRRTAKRTASKPAAPAKKAEDVDVAEPIIPDPIAGATEDDHLVEVVPPVTPPPAEPSFAIPVFMAPEPVTVVSDDVDDASADAIADADDVEVDGADDADDRTGSGDGADGTREPRPRRRRRGRGRGRGAQDDPGQNDGATDRDDRTDRTDRDDEPGAGTDAAKGGDAGVAKQDGKKRDERDANGEAEVPVVDEPVAIKGSTRLEAQRRRRADRRAESRKRHVISEAEFLARRESVERTMVVRERRRRDGHGMVTQVGVLEDDLLVEHFVTSDTQTSIIGDIYLGRVQNVLPSMEAAFIDIGTDRNGVLYSADVNWRAFGSSGRSRRIEHALKAGDQVLVQATKDPVGHKGARLSMQISLAGRFLVYVPGGHSAGISRKLPEPERKRLKEILKEVTPAGSGTIIRTAAEGVSKEAIAADVQRLEGLWQDIDKRTAEAKNRKGAKPVTMYEEPNMLIKVVRDLFNEDFSRLVVEGDKAWGIVRSYVDEVAPDLVGRLQRYRPEQHGGEDVFAHHRIDEQLAKALDRKVWLPSGGTLIIERTEAMTVIDVNTGKFTGAGGNLEETVTRNNLEAAEEIVRQMRLRDLGGMIVVDFIDMVLPENQDLVLRRLKEALGRDRTRHEVSEVTSLGLVQMTRKRLGTGLLETFSTTCEACDGRGLIIHVDPVDHEDEPQRGRQRRRNHAPAKHPVAEAMHRKANGDDGAEDSANDSADGTGEAQLDDGPRDASSDGRDGNGGNGRRRRGRGGARRGGPGQEPEQTGDDRARGDRSDDRPGAEPEQAPAEEMTEEERAVDESVTRAESEESRPPRRRRRGRRSTSRGRGGDGEGQGGEELSSDDADARRRETSRDNRDEHADVGDALARVAADAVAEARDKDPDEPSDDRYVSRSTRRRRRRRVVHAAQQGQGAGDDVREAAQQRDSGEARAERETGARREVKAETRTVTESGAESEKPEKPAQDDSGRSGEGAGRSGGGSRGRRRSTSRRGSAQAEQRAKETADVSEAPERAVSVEAKPQRGADDAPIEPQTYEEALAAFEKSPRRNRPTRGRSRSDHAPKPEDFGEGAGTRKGSGDATGATESKGATEAKAERKSAAGEKAGKAPAKGSGDDAGKGGRGESGAAKASASSRAASTSADEPKGGTAEATEAGSGDGRPARRRGRRRAVRRVTSRGPAGTSADAPEKDAPKKDDAAKAKSPGAQGEGNDGGVAKQDDAGRKPRRGRRRAVRRTSRG